MKIIGETVTPRIEEIYEAIRQCYGSLEEPTFWFVHDAEHERPYQSVEQALSRTFTLKEVTDTNDDVSFVYEVGRGERTWLLQLSMVGPFAVLLHDATGGGCEPVGLQAADEIEHEIIHAIQTRGIQILDREILEVPVALRLYNTDPGRVRVFQALFSDTDILPWGNA
ncbi:MAG TPA: hypothetical protein VFK13_09300 [Gemmatimonadaceae bacterium]|nr:hypothetical protein [Gemmatimonadaceae bacterium]